MNAKNNYQKKLEFCFVITLILIICLFYFIDRKINTVYISLKYNPPEMEIIQIPKTVQHQLRRARPETPVIPVPSDEVEILDEVTIQPESLDYSDISIINSESGERKNPSMMPRQIVEVVPDLKQHKTSGTIILALKIGVDGKMKEYKVITNTTDDPGCLYKVIVAIEKSRWQPAELNGVPVEYWIEKSYKFN